MISLKNNRKILILVKVFETISILVNFFAKSRYWSKFLENVDFRLSFLKTSFWSKFSKFSILVKIVKKSRFSSIFSQNLILVNIFEHFDFGQNFQKCWFWLKKKKSGKSHFW